MARRRGVRALVERDERRRARRLRRLFLTDGETAEVEQAYVKPALRGRGTGGGLVAAAARAGGASETFIVADDEGDPKRLYQRLGFRPVWIQHEFTRRPSANHLLRFGHDDRDHAEPLGRPLRPLRRDADDHPRRHDRERRPAVDPGGSRLLAVEPGLGGQRLSDRARRPAAAGRPGRRPARPPARLPGRDRAVHGRFIPVRRVGQPGDADRRSLRPGRRRRDGLGGRAGHDRHDVPRAARAGEGDRHLRLRGVRRRLDRPARRRRAHPGRSTGTGSSSSTSRSGSWPPRWPCGWWPTTAGSGSAAAPTSWRRAGDRRADARRVHDRRGGRPRLGLGPHARLRRAARWRCSPGSSRARRRRPTRCCRCGSSARATSPARTSPSS